MDWKANILQRIDELLEKDMKEEPFEQGIAEIASGTATLLEWFYGTKSTQLDMVLSLSKRVYESESRTHEHELIRFRNRLYGYLQTLKADITEGRIVNLQAEARGEVFGDFLTSARRALDEGEKNVAAVLACAALEDSLKQCAKSHSLDVDDADMSTVVGALKSVDAVDKTEGSILKGYTLVRNKAFHAQWDAIDNPAITSILAFTEQFLIKHFSR